MIQHAEFIMSNTDVEKCPAPDTPEYAFIGRSNVGKSSLINSFFGSKTAKTSKTPGRTRQINVFEISLAGMEEGKPNTFYLFDLPGYGHAAVSKAMSANWEKLMANFFAVEPARRLRTTTSRSITCSFLVTMPISPSSLTQWEGIPLSPSF